MPDQTVAFDHLIHWVDDIDATTTAYNDLGLEARAALTMPGFRNATWGIDDERYVELATVEDWEAVTDSKYAQAIELLKPAIDAMPGPGLLTFAVDVPDVHVTAARLREAGHAVVESQVRFEDKNIGFTEVFLRDAPPYFPFFITYDPPRAELARMRAAHRAAEGAVHDSRGPDLAAILVRSIDPTAHARRLAQLLGCTAAGATVPLNGAEIRFELGTSTALHGIAVRGLDASTEATQIAGMTVRFE